MTAEFWIIDAFTSVPFKGNPAAVCLLDEFPNERQMQRVAAQANLSETAFLVPAGALRYKLRWFTPQSEVSLCGHATLAAAHMLQHSARARAGDTLTFQSINGELRARLLERSIELDFPAQPGIAAKAPTALKALGAEILACERGGENYLVELRDYTALLACAPDFKKLKKLDAQGVIITTATGAEGFDFASRYFAPAIGIDEDPVTGSAHCMLAPYWAKTLGKTTFHAVQASRAQGILEVTLQGERVLIEGRAVTTLRGTLPDGALSTEHAA